MVISDIEHPAVTEAAEALNMAKSWVGTIAPQGVLKIRSLKTNLENDEQKTTPKSIGAEKSP